MVLSEKYVAQAIPIAGAAAGAALNYIFIDFYQQMARVHFALREVERHNDRRAFAVGDLDKPVRRFSGLPRAK